jgi:NADPH-dependent glutamate synthase beta subunit-like oxidoreductase
VLVLGAGNTGMDVARTARRLGNDAVCVDWLDRRFAIVRPDELAEAVSEGVEPRFSTTLVRLEGEDGHVQRAVVAHTKQRRVDERPTIVGRETEALAVDLVVMAMGYRTDPAVSATLPGTPVRRQAKGLPDRRWIASGILASHGSARPDGQPVGTVALGREAGMKAAELPLGERLWGAGDVLIGPATVVEAMAHGRRAAQAILLSHPRRREQAS